MEGYVPAYPFLANSIATCLPMPLDAPTTIATGLRLGLLIFAGRWEDCGKEE